MAYITLVVQVLQCVPQCVITAEGGLKHIQSLQGLQGEEGLERSRGELHRQPFSMSTFTLRHR